MLEIDALGLYSASEAGKFLIFEGKRLENYQA